MKVKKRVTEHTDDGLMSILAYRFMPYWPLFLLLSLLFLIPAYIYTKYLTPVYSISATLVISDKEKGVEESETLRSLNVYATNKIVENEIQVLQSRTLMREVVHGLHLYAQVWEQGRVKPAPAYLTSPIIVEANEPESVRERKSIFFQYNEADERVQIEGRFYPIGQWVRFPYGMLRFLKNPHVKYITARPLYFSLSDPRKVTVGMMSNLEVGATSKLSSVINVKYTDAIPERGEDIVDSLMTAYLRLSVQNNNQLATNTLAFVSDRVRQVERELDSINRSIQRYKSAQGIVDISEQGRLYLQNASESDAKASEINRELAVLEQVSQYVMSGMTRPGVVPTTLGISDPVLAQLLQRHNELVLQYANLRTTTGENNPLPRSVESEIEKIRPNILNIVRNQRARLRAGLASLNNTSGRFNAMLRTLPGKERELLEISRQQAIKNDVYAFLLQRQEEAELSAASTIADSRIVDSAEASITPVSSKKTLVLLGAIIAAIALGVAYVFLRESMSGKVLFRSGIDKTTSIPVVAELPYRKKRKLTLIQSAADGVLGIHLKRLQIVLGLFNGQTIRQKVLVTSGIASEGKTFVSNHLAISLAAAGQRVLLMDFNFYRPETSAHFGLKDTSGISNVLEGKADLQQVIHKTDVPGLDILPAGISKSRPDALLLDHQMHKLMLAVEHRYDFIIMDTPPTEITTDAFLLGRYADVSLYVVRQGKTPNTLLKKLDDNEKLGSLPQIGLLFNGVKPRGFFRRYYGYGYGYGYENVYTPKTYKRLD